MYHYNRGKLSSTRNLKRYQWLGPRQLTSLSLTDREGRGGTGGVEDESLYHALALLDSASTASSAARTSDLHPGATGAAGRAVEDPRGRAAARLLQRDR